MPGERLKHSAVPTRDETQAEKNEAHLPDYERDRGTAELHDRAYRARCGIVGRLMSCVCAWPEVVEPTPSGHHDACPAARAADLRERYAHVFVDEPDGRCGVCGDEHDAHQHQSVDERHLWFCPAHRLVASDCPGCVV